MTKTQFFDCKNTSGVKIPGLVIDDKYSVGKLIDYGAFGFVHECSDSTGSPMVVKFSEDHNTTSIEIRTLLSMAKKSSKNVTEIIDYGILVFDNLQSQSN